MNDYRNPLLAEAMKVLGMVNKYNRGIAKANRELEKNGNPTAKFDVNKLTEFRVTIMTRNESGTIKSGTINVDEKEKRLDIGEEQKNEENVSPKSGTIKSGTIKSGTINLTNTKIYNIDTLDDSVLIIISENPGIKKDRIFLQVQTSLRTIQRSLTRLSKKDKIEYRGSKRTGGWFVKT